MAETSKIMVVEDERITAQDIQISLEKIGYEVPAVSSSGEDAIEKAKKYRPDLILMDIVLRGEMNGIQTAKAIRDIYKVPIVYLTAYADQRTINSAKKTEPYGYILKPFEDRELQSTIEMALYKHKMEKKLQESQEWLSITLNSMGDGVIATDCDEKIVFMNPVAEKLTGWKEKQAVGQPLNEVFQVIYENTGEPIRFSLTNITQDSSSMFDSDTLLIARNGRQVPIESSRSPLKDDNDDLYGLVLIFHDNTERRRAEAALKESEERYRNLFEDSRDAIYITTKDGRFVVLNQATLDLFKFSKNEMSKININELYYDEQERDQFKKIIQEEGSVRDYEIRLKNKKEEILHCLLTTSLKKDSEGRILGYQGIIRDITARKNAEHEKTQIQAQLFQAQKMEAIGILAGGVAHDLNNMMTAVQGFTDMALLKLDEDTAVYSDLQEVQTAAGRAIDLTRQLLLFSRKQPMIFKTLNLNRVVEQLLKMLHRLIGEDIKIKTDLTEGLEFIKADAGHIEQVVMNLCLNSRDAMPNGGELLIRTENIIVDTDYCEHHSEAKSGNHVKLSVKDTGMGMTAETIEHIFDPFFSTKGPGKGTGLGLSVVYGIVKQHNGWIDVISQIEKGTTFEVFFPCGQSKEKAKEESSQEDINIEGNGERILVIEDEISVRDLIMRVLKKNGYVGFEANSAEEALEIFEKEKGKFDLILSDVVLPGMSGIDLVDIIKDRNPNIKIILSSGYPDKKSKWADIQEKGYAFLQKSYTLPVLLKTIKKELQK